MQTLLSFNGAFQCCFQSDSITRLDKSNSTMIMEVFGKIVYHAILSNFDINKGLDGQIIQY